MGSVGRAWRGRCCYVVDEVQHFYPSVRRFHEMALVDLLLCDSMLSLNQEMLRHFVPFTLLAILAYEVQPYAAIVIF